MRYMKILPLLTLAALTGCTENLPGSLSYEQSQAYFRVCTAVAQEDNKCTYTYYYPANTALLKTACTPARAWQAIEQNIKSERLAKVQEQGLTLPIEVIAKLQKKIGLKSSYAYLNEAGTSSYECSPGSPSTHVVCFNLNKDDLLCTIAFTGKPEQASAFTPRQWNSYTFPHP